jgi:hypothetical protein
MSWASPSGASTRRDSEGRAAFRRDGFIAQLMATATQAGPRGPTEYITAIEAIAPR